VPKTSVRRQEGPSRPAILAPGLQRSKAGGYAWQDVDIRDSDFAVFAQKLGLVETRYKRILQSFVDSKEAVFSLIDRCILPDDCKQLYKEQVQDSARALSYSYAGLR
jgi:hypothetical protein